MRRFATAVLIWSALFVLGQTDAVACTCVQVTLESRYERSANVFTAVVIDEYSEPADERTPVRSTFRITETFKGRPPFLAFVSHPYDGECGIDLEAGVEYLFFASDSGGVSMCSGIARSEDAEPQIAALKSFVSGEHPDLAEPWHFGSSEHGCSLVTSFDVAEDYTPGHLDISTSEARATIDPQFDVNELSIRIGSGTLTDSDQEPSPLRLTVNDTVYTAPWTTDRVIRLPTDVRDSLPFAVPDSIPVRDSYLLRGNSVEDLLRKLTMSDALLIRYDANGLGPNVDIEVRTTNLADTGVRMLECIRSQRTQ